MSERKGRCRYLRRNQQLCGIEVMFEGSMMLCQHHLFEAYTMLQQSGTAMVAALKANRGAGPAPDPERPPFEPRQFDGIVYYIRFGDRIKIGTTTNLARRLQVIPHDEVLATEPGGYQQEQMRHREFGYCRIQNEWFDGTNQRLLSHVAALREKHGLLSL